MFLVRLPCFRTGMSYDENIIEKNYKKYMFKPNIKISNIKRISKREKKNNKEK